MYDPFSLENKTILVTGASSGIGKAIAIESSRMGAKVIITGRNEKRLKETFSLLEGDNNEFIIADLSVQEELEKLSKRGISALWLIGIWERSPASKKIKELYGTGG